MTEELQESTIERQEGTGCCVVGQGENLEIPALGELRGLNEEQIRAQVPAWAVEPTLSTLRLQGRNP